MNYHDYYKTLGVGKKASQDEIQKSYRKLARKYHPDINKDPETEAKFKEINEAYEVLKDPEKRQKYDQFGSAWKQAQRTGSPPPGFEDIFSQFGFGGAGFGGPGGQGRSVRFDFGDLGGRGAGDGGFSSFFETLFGGGAPGGAGAAWNARPQASQGSRDYETKISLSIEEAGRGGKRQIRVTDPATGKQRTLRVSIPKGIRPGQKIRLAGQGGTGGSGAGGGRGDLYLTVEILPHPDFRLDDSNLHTIIPITPWEAALGGQAKIRTLDGEVTVKIPAGSSSGRKVRLKGKGFPKKNGVNGDLFGEIKIMVPTELTDRDRELFEQLAKDSEFNPRGQS
ncbi:MAG: DnaJ domain-containing protein [bacterium]|nr:DnaJ domain-containing protein [bacterium]